MMVDKGLVIVSEDPKNRGTAREDEGSKKVTR